MQTSKAGYKVVTVPGGGGRNFSITLYPESNGAGQALFQRVGRFIRDENAVIVSQRVFTGPGAKLDGAGELLRDGAAAWPLTRLEGNGACRGTVTHIHLDAVSGVLVKPIECDGCIVGAVYEDGDVTFAVLGNLRPDDQSASRNEQALSVFEKLEAALDSAGMAVHDLVRTWFFIDRILDWYGDFNSVRTAIFNRWGMFNRALPASTGIGAANNAGAAIVADALAVKSTGRRLEITDVASPLQCAATSYKSSFSRAVEVDLPGRRCLYVSGTASIAPDGQTTWVGDLDRQVALTMDVVLEILRSRGMSWCDVTRAIAYFKEVCRRPALERYCRGRGLPDLPVVVASADICRDDLLFEIEVDAVAPASET